MNFKSNMFSKGLSLCLALVLVLLAFQTTGFAAVEPEHNDVLKVYDWETSATSYGDATDTGDLAYGKGRKIVPPATWGLVTSPQFNVDTSKFVLSFDFKAEQTNHYFKVWMQNNKDENFAEFALDTNGKVVFDKRCWSYNCVSDTYGSDFITSEYTANKWYKVDVVGEVINGVYNLSFFLDGEKLGTATKSFSDATRTGVKVVRFLSSYSEIENRLEPSNPIKPNQNGILWVDNLKLVDYSKNNTFYATSKKDIDPASTNGIIEFSEMPCFENANHKDAFLNSIKVLDPTTNKELKIGNPSFDGSYVIIPFKDELVGGREYAIAISEDIKSVTGKNLLSDMIYFNTKESATSIETLLGSIDFEKEVVDGSDVKAYITDSNTGIVDIVQNADDKPATYSVVNYAGVGNVLKFEASQNDWQTYSGPAFKVTGDSYQENPNIIISYNVCVDETTPTGTFSTMIGSEDAITYSDKQSKVYRSNKLSHNLFDKHGDFKALSASLNISGGLFANKGEANSYYAFTPYNANTWYNVKIYIDRVNNKCTTYFDGKEMKITSNDLGVTSDRDVQWIVFYMPPTNFSGHYHANSGTTLYVDNINVGYPSSSDIKKVSKLRFNNGDGDKFGPLSDEIDVQGVTVDIHYNGSVDTENAVVTLSDGATEQTFTEGVYDEANNIYTVTIGNILKSNTQYTLDVSGVEGAYDYKTYFTTKEENVKINSFYLANSNGEEVKTLSDVLTDKKVYLVFDAINPTSAPEDITAIIAVYEDHTLVDSNFKKFTVSSLGSASLDLNSDPLFTQLSSTDGAVIKGFLWNNFVKLQPRTKCLEVE